VITFWITPLVYQQNKDEKYNKRTNRNYWNYRNSKHNLKVGSNTDEKWIIYWTTCDGNCLWNKFEFKFFPVILYLFLSKIIQQISNLYLSMLRKLTLRALAKLKWILWKVMIRWADRKFYKGKTTVIVQFSWRLETINNYSRDANEISMFERLTYRL